MSVNEKRKEVSADTIFRTKIVGRNVEDKGRGINQVIYVIALVDDDDDQVVDPDCGIPIVFTSHPIAYKRSDLVIPSTSPIIH